MPQGKHLLQRKQKDRIIYVLTYVVLTFLESISESLQAAIFTLHFYYDASFCKRMTLILFEYKALH